MPGRFVKALLADWGPPPREKKISKVFFFFFFRNASVAAEVSAHGMTFGSSESGTPAYMPRNRRRKLDRSLRRRTSSASCAALSDSHRRPSRTTARVCWRAFLLPANNEIQRPKSVGERDAAMTRCNDPHRYANVRIH